MKIKLLSSFLLITFLFSGCRFWGVRGSGDIETDERNISEFTKLDVSGAFTVYVKVGGSTSLSIEADDNLLRYITTRVRGDRLIIKAKRDLNPRRDIEIKVTTPDLMEIDASGANSLMVEGIDSRNFEIDMSGANELDISGETDNLSIELSGACSVNAKKLIANNVKVDLSGACGVDVYASESIRAEASGASSIDYYGDPDRVKTDISGVGSVSRR